MRFAPVLLSLFVLFAVVPLAGAEDRDPTPAELATMILDGRAAEHALVAAWLEKADRAALRAVFAQVRRLRAERTAPRAQPIAGAQGKPAPKDAPEAQGPLVNAEMRILEFSVDEATAVLGASRPTADRSVHLLDAEAAAALLRRVKQHAGAKIVSAPRLTVYDRQEANVSLLNQVSYVQDYDIEVQGQKTIADPIVDVVQEGIVIQFTPACAENGTDVALEFEGTFSSLQRPIPEKQIELGGQKVTIQLPQVEVGRIRESVVVPSGGWVLLGGGVTFQPRQGGPRVERVALVQVERLEAAALRRAPRKGR